MSKKPTYEELEKEIKKPYQDAAERNRTEEAYRNIVESSPMGMHFYELLENDRLVFTGANPAADRLLGVDNQAYIGKTIEEAFPPLSQTEIPERYRQAARHGIPWETEQIDYKDNQIVGAFEVRAFQISSNKMAAIFGDITNRKKIEVKLKDSEKRYRLIAENVADVIWTMDMDFNFTYISPSIYQQRGYTAKEAMNHSLEESVLPESLEETMNFFVEKLSLIESGNEDGFIAVDFEVQQPCKDGSVIWTSNNARILPDHNMRAAGILGITRDITERKQSEETIKTFKTISDKAVHGNAIADLNGNLIYINHYFSSIHGYRQSDLLPGKNLSIFHNDKQIIAVKEINQYLQKNGSYGPTEVWHCHKDGTEFPMLMSGILLRDAKGKPQYVAATAINITKQKQAEIERERLITAIEQAGESIVITDPDGIIQYANPAFKGITGYSNDEVIGQNPRFLKSGHHGKSFYEELWDTILSGNRWAGQLINKHKDKTLYTSECAITPVKDKNGDIMNFVWVARDITKELELENRIAQAQRMESIGTLAGGIAHDFNNILFPIVGMSEMMMEDLSSDSDLYENAEEIFKAARRGSKLVAQILAFSRQSEYRKIPVQVHKILKEAFKLSRSTIPSNIKIIQDIQTDCGPVMADPTQIHQIAMNLITNAYHAVEEGGGKISIELKEIAIDNDDLTDSQLQPGRYALLRFSDTGYGIEPALMDKIFDPYFTTKKKSKGTGLGLAVVYGIVKEHKGDIKVYSELEKGTAFSVYLPLMDKSVEDVSNGKTKDGTPGSERILVVDDDEAILMLERQMLERMGYRVTSCSDGFEALKIFRSDPEAFDLVFSDMTMPNMTGDQLAQALFSIKPGIPIIICTGFSEKMSQEKATTMGISGFLMKPVVKSELAKMIRKVLD